MTEEVTINHKVYQAIRLAAEAVMYSPDYITRLAREKKITAVQLGRRWYVHVDSLRSYAEVQQQEQIIKQKHLRQERKSERMFRKGFSATRQTQHSIEHKVIATIAGMLAVGTLIGSQFAAVSSVKTNTAIVADSQRIPVIKKTMEEKMLQAQFSPDQSKIFVESERVMVRPGETNINWQYIQHE